MTRSDPWTLWLDGWSLAFEASEVIGMRMSKLAHMDAAAAMESQRMVGEKIAVIAQLQAKAMSGALGIAPGTQAARTLSHYRKAVAKNRRRLSRKGA